MFGNFALFLTLQRRQKIMIFHHMHASKKNVSVSVAVKIEIFRRLARSYIYGLDPRKLKYTYTGEIKWVMTQSNNTHKKTVLSMSLKKVWLCGYWKMYFNIQGFVKNDSTLWISPCPMKHTKNFIFSDNVIFVAIWMHILQ